MARLAAQELQKMQMLVVWGEIFRAESSQGRWVHQLLLGWQMMQVLSMGSHSSTGVPLLLEGP